MIEFLQIYDYFHITPAQFFDTFEKNSALMETTISELKKLDESDVALISLYIRRLLKEPK